MAQFQQMMNLIIGRALEVNNEKLSQDISSLVNDKMDKELEFLLQASDQKEEERFRQLMLSSGDMANDVGSIVYGEEAVAEGLMDRVGTLSDALNALYRQMEQ